MLYTLGEWVVKPGREDDFVESWREMAEWTANEFAPGATAVLARDRADPSRFVSFGPWESDEQVNAWRENDGFVLRVGRIRELLKRFEPQTLDPVVSVGPGSD
jgi:heme-degrading monooxygenase HmoA